MESYQTYWKQLISEVSQVSSMKGETNLIYFHARGLVAHFSDNLANNSEYRISKYYFLWVSVDSSLK